MTEAETILAMIEKVDPADTAGLDEIDNAVADYIKGWHPDLWDVRPEYTRSRDALKSIRPDGWKIDLGHNVPTSQFCFSLQDRMGPNCNYFDSPWLPTEELAELHAILQAIAHDRSLADKREGV